MSYTHRANPLPMVLAGLLGLLAIGLWIAG